ncbi:MAG TPA: carboxypeptidase-like regulatory domain-containing protein, partial [Anaerolineales bacterium]|nr:carboxypeptidase-like regulatory domain-containing protein [Anaerolineales bacterium]
MKLQRACLTVVTLLFLILAQRADSQTIVTGAVTGTVTDETGAVIEGASVSLKSSATGEVQTQTSSGSGKYQFVLLKPGEYTLTVSKEGFKTSVQTVSIQLGQTSTANTKL